MDDEEIMNILFDAMLKANPKLEIFRSLPFKSKEFMYPTGGVIGGACSKMNIDDIKDYIENKTEIVEYPKGYPNLGEYKLKRTNNEKEYNEFINRLYKKKINIHYFPSIKTMKKILNQI